jgi:hypothetical protein
MLKFQFQKYFKFGMAVDARASHRKLQKHDTFAPAVSQMLFAKYCLQTMSQTNNWIAQDLKGQSPGKSV